MTQKHVRVRILLKIGYGLVYVDSIPRFLGTSSLFRVQFISRTGENIYFRRRVPGVGEGKRGGREEGRKKGEGKKERRLGERKDGRQEGGGMRW